MSFVCDPEYIKAFESVYRIVTDFTGKDIPILSGAVGRPDRTMLAFRDVQVFQSDDAGMGRSDTDTAASMDPGLHPDILSKLFEENMKAGDKKRTGAFYTSYEIARFMCRESLAHYLSNTAGLSFEDAIGFIYQAPGEVPKHSFLFEILHKSSRGIDSALEKLRVFDPAAGCGVFVLCMLEEIVRLRMSIVTYMTSRGHCALWERNPKRLGYETVRNSIFAADIDQTAVAITKLRLWHRLQTYDDAGSTDTEREIPRFSSFECNIECADSLFEYDGCGFDIVIGNPPYISAVEGSKSARGLRQALRKRFPQLSGAFDIYTAFLLDGVQKTNDNGVYCWIVPNKLFASQYATPVLRYLSKHGLKQSISISDIGAFPKIGVYPIIITGNKHIAADSSNEKTGMAVSQEICECYSKDMDDLINRIIYPRDKLNEYRTFSEYNIRIASGAAGFQARSLSEYISEDVTCPDGNDQCKSYSINGSIPFIVSGSIDKYSVRYDKVRYMGSLYNKPLIAKGPKIADSKWKLWCSEKICIAGLTKELEAYYSPYPLALGVGVYAIYDFGGFDPLFLLGILNSRFMSWYVNKKFYERHLSGQYLAINKSTLEQLPLVYADKTLQNEIGQRAGKLLELNLYGAEVNREERDRLMQEIDEMAYQLYGCREIRGQA